MPRPPGRWEVLGPGGPAPVKQADKGAFAREVLTVLSEHKDIASEACWQELSQVIAQYWLVFQNDQSPLSTWNMLSKCTEVILRIRLAQKSAGAMGGQDALEEFRSFMGDILGDETGELPGK